MKRNLLVILLSCIFTTSSLSLTACTDTHTESTEVESTEENDVDENEDEVESIQESVDESEEQKLQEGSPEIVEGEDIPSDDEPSPYIEPLPAEVPTAEETPSGELVCPQCNKVVPYISRYGVCDECYAANNNYGNCTYCGNPLTSVEVQSVLTNRCFGCKDICIMCGSHGVDASQIMEYGDVICGNCWMMYCMPCQNCGNVGNLTWSGDGRILCPECIAALNS